MILLKRSLVLQKGFALLEVILAGAIVIAMGVLYVQGQNREQNVSAAQNVGKQMVTINSALNAYIIAKYPQLAAITSAPGTAVVTTTATSAQNARCSINAE